MNNNNLSMSGIAYGIRYYTLLVVAIEIQPNEYYCWNFLYTWIINFLAFHVARSIDDLPVTRLLAFAQNPKSIEILISPPFFSSLMFSLLLISNFYISRITLQAMRSKLNGAQQIRIDVKNWIKNEKRWEKIKHSAHFNQNIYQQQSLEGIWYEIAAKCDFFLFFAWKRDAFSTIGFSLSARGWTTIYPRKKFTLKRKKENMWSRLMYIFPKRIVFTTKHAYSTVELREKWGNNFLWISFLIIKRWI